MGVRAWWRRLRRRMSGRDRIEESEARLHESELENTEDNLRRVRVLEENRWRTSEILSDHGFEESARMERETARALSGRRVALENRRARQREPYGDDVAFDVLDNNLRDGEE